MAATTVQSSPALTLTVELEGVDRVLVQLNEYKGRLTDLRPAWGKILVYMRAAMANQFASEGGRGGSAWQPLSERYAAEKIISHPGMPILRRDDVMFRSLTEETEDSFIENEPLTFAYGTRDPKANWHQYGKGRLPVREVLVLTDEDIRAIEQFVFDHVNGGAGLGLVSIVGLE